MKHTLTDIENLPPWEWRREEAKQIILETLRGQGPESERVTAAHLAGDLVVMDDEVAVNLLAIATNNFEPEELRATAAIAFGAVLESTDIKDEDDPDDPPEINWELRDRIQDTLRAIQADQRAPKELRRRALEASIRAPRDWHPQAIRAAFASPDEEWNLTAIFCARWIRHLFKPEILQMLDSANEDIRREAVYAAGTNGLEEAWPAIADLLESPDTDKELLLTAIESASNFRTEESRMALEVLLDSDDEDVVEAVHEALAMLGPDDDDDLEDDDFEDEDEEENGDPR